MSRVERVFAAVKKYPGIATYNIPIAASVSYENAVQALKKLRDDGRINVKRKGKGRKYYAR